MPLKTEEQKRNLKRVGEEKRILRNAKDLTADEAIFKAFPEAKPDEEYGVTACGEDLVVRRIKRNTDGQIEQGHTGKEDT